MGKIIPELSAGKQQRDDSSEDLKKRQDLDPRGNSEVDVAEVLVQLPKEKKVEKLTSEWRLKKVN